jgi:hypothetical protein
MEKGKASRTRLLLGSVLVVATSIATLSLASAPAQAYEAGCIVQSSSGEIERVPVGNEWYDGAYTVVVENGKVYHRHKIYRCGENLLWQDTGRYFDLEVEVIGCCPGVATVGNPSCPDSEDVRESPPGPV